MTHSQYSNRILQWAIGISLVVHAMVLGIKFAAPAVIKWEKNSPIILSILINSKTKEASRAPTAIAQNNLDGGGNLDEKGWTPSSPLERGATQAILQSELKEGDSDKSVESLEAEIKQLIVQSKQKKWETPSGTIAFKEKKEKKEGSDLLAMELAARIDKQVQLYASRPKKMFVGAQTVQSDLAIWIETWQRKVETIGNDFYPEQARGKIRGTLILTAGVGKDGNIASIEIEKSSGKKILDDSAKRILHLAAPFEPFDAKMAKKVDILYITRQWKFGPEGLEGLASDNTISHQ